MRHCSVSVLGKDGETHTREVDATSLFEAAEIIIKDWNRLWWWSTSSLIEIQSGSDRWRVTQESVRKWRQKKRIS